MRKLVAVLACRNQSTRLYAKPLQNLDIQENFTILDYIIKSLKTYPHISDIVLAISSDPGNEIYEIVAAKHNISYIVGSEKDVLSRLIIGCKSVNGTDIFRLTSESPFTYIQPISQAWKDHLTFKRDLTALDCLPDGSGFEIINLAAYEKSWAEGCDRHRSELCSLYIRENKHLFNIGYVDIPQHLRRLDIRLTVDYPEDLILCRYVYSSLHSNSFPIQLEDIINLLDASPHITSLVEPFIEAGLETMYI